MELIASLTIFVVVIALVMSEKVNRTIAALAGASLILLLRIMTFNEALSYIDFNTLGVLVGMMIIVGIVKNTGVFEYLAIFSAKKVRGDPWKIILSLSLITAVVSGILDNVTTVLLIVPMTFVITDTLELDPITFLIPEIIASNLGGTATLIGDPPNIMIGSESGLGFLDFVVNLGPIVVVIFAATFFIFRLLFRKQLQVSEEKKQEIQAFDERKSIKNPVLLKKCLVVLVLVIAGFCLHEQLNYPSALVALSGAALLLLLSGESVDEVFTNVEWPTLFFFGGLFVLVGALEKVGFINDLATVMIHLTKNNLLLTGIIIIWFSALASSVLDNIPFVATLIPLVKAMGAQGGMNIAPLWWAISLGACLGGNGTLIGASANVIVSGLAAKRGCKLTFMRYLKYGLPMMILSIILSTLYLILFYLL
jgi:Na+/H+ antiporter NhaD/arsenite permease-like protein